MRRALWALAGAGLACAAAAQDDPAARLGWHDAGQRPSPVRELRLAAPRPFGYLVGDRVRHRITVTVAEPARLQGSSLPVRQRLAEWLELQEVELDSHQREAGRRYTLTLTYQIFATPLGVDNRSIPGFTLRFDRAGESLPVEIPGWTFAQSALLAGDIAHEGENIVAMRPDMAPPTLATARPRAGLALSAALAITGGGWLAWLYRPRRRRGRFAAAHRALARLDDGTADAERLRQGYRQLHRAFDATAGQAVFAADVPAFCRAHPAFAPHQTAIAAFFEDSRQLFFGNAPTEADASARWQALRRLARDCRDAERAP